MLNRLAKIIGGSDDKVVRRMQPNVDKINAIESEIEALSDDGLRSKTAEFKDRLAQGEVLEDLMTEAFAVVREAAKRTLQQRHFDVQLVGGMVLHKGKIAAVQIKPSISTGMPRSRAQLKARCPAISGLEIWTICGLKAFRSSFTKSDKPVGN